MAFLSAAMIIKEQQGRKIHLAVLRVSVVIAAIMLQLSERRIVSK